VKLRLKPIGEQVIVVTGASSGIGLVTARQAAAAGARVVLAARNGPDLEHAVTSIRESGGRATFVVTDVADPAQVDALARAAAAEFGRIDTWVNNAAVSMYGRIVDLSIADMRRQMDVNYWGQVYGSIAAVRALRRSGGALINVASALSDRAIPLQGVYCAAKHAVKAFTETLRMELEAEGVPVAVTLVKRRASIRRSSRKPGPVSASNRSRCRPSMRQRSSPPSSCTRRSIHCGRSSPAAPA
jgi:NAD(P)-dependent dehydrogenase (short-subunit alcohol dehydrogenase family)